MGPSLPRPGRGACWKMGRASRPASKCRWRSPLLPGVLHVLDLVELGVDQLAIHALDLAEIDCLDDIAGIGVDHDRAARAVDLEALEGLHRLVAIDLALELL